MSQFAEFSTPLEETWEYCTLIASPPWEALRHKLCVLAARHALNELSGDRRSRKLEFQRLNAKMESGMLSS
jgi:hypothetical protein